MSQSTQDESYLFLVRAYGVQELAVRYFPDVLPASATRHLTRLIRGDGELLDKLIQIGYKRGCRNTRYGASDRALPRSTAALYLCGRLTSCGALRPYI